MDLDEVIRVVETYVPVNSPRRYKAIKFLEKLKTQTLTPKEYGMVMDTNRKVNAIASKLKDIELYEEQETSRKGRVQY